MSRQQHDKLLTAIRNLKYALKDSTIRGPRTDDLLKTLDDLKAKLHANVPMHIASQSDI